MRRAGAPRYEKAIQLNRKNDRFPKAPKKKPQPIPKEKIKRELMVILCSERQLDAMKEEEKNSLKTRFPKLKIRYRTYLNTVDIGACNTFHDLVPALANLRKKPKYLSFIFDEIITRYNVREMTNHQYNRKIGIFRQNIVNVLPQEQQEAARQCDVTNLVNIFNDLVITDDERTRIGRIPNKSIIQSEQQRDQEWSHMMILYRLIRSAIEHNDLR